MRSGQCELNVPYVAHIHVKHNKHGPALLDDVGILASNSTAKTNVKAIDHTDVVEFVRGHFEQFDGR